MVRTNVAEPVPLELEAVMVTLLVPAVVGVPYDLIDCRPVRRGWILRSHLVVADLQVVVLSCCILPDEIDRVNGGSGAQVDINPLLIVFIGCGGAKLSTLPASVDRVVVE